MAKKKVGFIRLIIGAFIGASLYCLVLFIPMLFQFYNALFIEIIMAISLYITFKPRSIKEMCQFLLILNIAAFAVGGMGITIFYMLDFSNFIGTGIHTSFKNYPIKLLFAATLLSYVVIKLAKGWINTNVINSRKFCSATIEFQDKTIEVTALVDSGSSLIEPISKLPVMVVEFTTAEKLFSKELITSFYKKGVLDINEFLLHEKDNEIIKRLKLIPFSSLGNSGSTLIGFKPDLIKIFDKENKLINTKDAVVAFYDKPLCSDKGYNALVNPDIFII